MKAKSPNPLFYLSILIFVLFLNPCEGAMTSDFGSMVVRIALPSTIDQSNGYKMLASDLSFELKGYRFDKSAKFLESELNWPAIPSGKYQFRLIGLKSEEVYSGELLIVPREEVALTIIIRGPEHGPFSGKYHALHMISGGSHPGLVKTYHHDWIEGRFESGIHEIFHDGFVFWRKDSGETGFRFDADYDLVADEEDLDDDNDGIPDQRDWDDDGDGIPDLKDHRDPDRDEDGILNGSETRDLMLGLLQDPIVENVEVRNLFSPLNLDDSQIGDVLEIKARIHTAGGAPIDKVMVSIFQNGSEYRSLELRDDGSSQDLEESFPGAQISGDRKSDDKEFTMLIPLGIDELEHIFPSVLIVEGINKLKMRSNRWSFYVSNSIEPPKSSMVLSNRQLEPFTLEVIRNASKSSRIIKYDFLTPKGSAVKKLEGLRTSPLIPQRNALSFSQYFDTVTVQSGELFLLTVVEPDYRIFYAGNQF